MVLAGDPGVIDRTLQVFDQIRRSTDIPPDTSTLGLTLSNFNNYMSETGYRAFLDTGRKTYLERHRRFLDQQVAPNS